VRAERGALYEREQDERKATSGAASSDPGKTIAHFKKAVITYIGKPPDTPPYLKVGGKLVKGEHKECRLSEKVLEREVTFLKLISKWAPERGKNSRNRQRTKNCLLLKGSEKKLYWRKQDLPARIHSAICRYKNKKNQDWRNPEKPKIGRRWRKT